MVRLGLGLEDYCIALDNRDKHLSRSRQQSRTFHEAMTEAASAVAA